MFKKIHLTPMHAFLLLPSGPMAKPEGMLAIMPTNLNNMVFTETKEVIFPAVTTSFQKKQTNPKKTENGERFEKIKKEWPTIKNNNNKNLVPVK